MGNIDFPPVMTSRMTFADIEDDFKLFSNLFGASDAPDTSPMAKTDRLWAAVDVSESDKEFDLRVDVPGLSEKDINIKARRSAAALARLLAPHGRLRSDLAHMLFGTH